MSREEQQEDVTTDRNSESLPDKVNKVERLDREKIDLEDKDKENRKERKRSNKTPFIY